MCMYVLYIYKQLYIYNIVYIYYYYIYYILYSHLFLLILAQTKRKMTDYANVSTLICYSISQNKKFMYQILQKNIKIKNFLLCT